MSPIAKIRARADAFDALGVSQSAAPAEIHAAWKRLAFEVHPDRNGGDCSRFMQAKAAYDLVRKATPVEAGRVAANAAKRPTKAARFTALSEEVIAACRALLEDGAESALPDDTAPHSVDARDHVAKAVERCGREITYHVATPLVEGINRVALPTALLKDNRRVKPRILPVRAVKGGSGAIVIPNHVRERTFPGARQVRIKFGVDVPATEDA